MTTFNLSNGAAHVAIACLQSGLTAIEDIYVGGSLALKLKKAKILPTPEKTENQLTYNDRTEKWLSAPFGELSMSKEEIEVLNSAFKTMEEKKSLPVGVFFDATLEVIQLLKSTK